MPWLKYLSCTSWEELNWKIGIRYLNFLLSNLTTKSLHHLLQGSGTQIKTCNLPCKANAGHMSFDYVFLFHWNSNDGLSKLPNNSRATTKWSGNITATLQLNKCLTKERGLKVCTFLCEWVLRVIWTHRPNVWSKNLIRVSIQYTIVRKKNWLVFTL